MKAADLSRADWRKSRHSGSNGNCVEVASDKAVLVRDTTDRDGGTLAFNAATWREFVSGIK